jgi:hypothetical protein
MLKHAVKHSHTVISVHTISYSVYVEVSKNGVTPKSSILKLDVLL